MWKRRRRSFIYKDFGGEFVVIFTRDIENGQQQQQQEQTADKHQRTSVGSISANKRLH